MKVNEKGYRIGISYLTEFFIGNGYMIEFDEFLRVKVNIKLGKGRSEVLLFANILHVHNTSHSLHKKKTTVIISYSTNDTFSMFYLLARFTFDIILLFDVVLIRRASYMHLAKKGFVAF